MYRRSNRTTRRAAMSRRSSRKVSRPWTREEMAFMRKYYRNNETSWVARELGRTVYSVRYKAVDLRIRKANPSIWRGNTGSTSGSRKSSPRRTTRSAWSRTSQRRWTRRSRNFRAMNTRRMPRRAMPRRTRRSR